MINKDMCKILFEDSFNSLYRNTKNNFDTPRDQTARRVQIPHIDYIPTDSGLQIKAKTRTENEQYETIIFLEGIQFSDENDNNAVEIIASNNSKFYILPFNRNSKTKVNCSCLDFHYRFAVWNDNSDALYGDAPSPYVKKTDRPPVNPKKIPGMCKHIIEVFNTLINDKIIK